jgi:hypothetical protein
LAATLPARSTARCDWLPSGDDPDAEAVDPQPYSPDHDDQAAQPPSVGRSRAMRMTATISSTVGGSAG